MPTPAVAAAERPDVLRVRKVAVQRPLIWLRLGWRDFTRTPWASALHGIVIAAGGVAIFAAALERWYFLPGAFSGFVLVGPILATGLYEQSRLLARGKRPTFSDAVHAWQRGTRPLVCLGLLLAVAGTLWVLVSAGLFALFVKTPIDDARAFLRYVVHAQGDLLFLIWLAAGGLGAALVFAATAVSPPLLLGRVISLRSAILTSVRAVGENPLALALWATIIMIAMALSIATAMLGFIITVPVLGHATWHAYRDLVDTSSVPLRY
jgi:uncharacterized membrane protein